MFGSGIHYGSLARLLGCAALVSCIACSGSEGKSDGSLSSLGIDDGASTGATSSALVTADAPAVLKLNTGARLDIPEGSVTKQLKVDLTRPADDKALPLLKMVQSEYKVASAPYVVTPHGSTFEKELELTLPIAKGNKDRLLVAHLDDEDDTSWEIHSIPKISGNTAKIPVRHFSVYVLLEYVEHEELDAGSEPDVLPPLTGTLQEKLAMRLEQCGLVAQSGSYQEDWGTLDDEDLCEIDCMFAARCGDFEAVFCEQSDASAAILSCFDACQPYPDVNCETEYDGLQRVSACDGYEDCLDGSDETTCPDSAFLACESFGGGRVPTTAKCDGYEDCADGSDEVGCPASLHFICEDNGERIQASLECDGYEDCYDGSDEARCELFTCSDGEQQIPRRLLCDLSHDCSDGSDEEQGCIKLTCELPADEISTSVPQALTSKRRHH